MSEQSKALWQYTEDLGGAIKYNPLFEEPAIKSPEGLYNGRSIIARDTPINGGIYLHIPKDEGIIVDDIIYPKELNNAYQEAEKWFYKNPVSRFLRQQRGSSVFELIYKVTHHQFGGDKPLIDINFEVEQIIDETLAAKKTKSIFEYNEIPLNLFMQRKAGVCRHQALLSAYIIERLINEERMAGKVSIDRNFIPQKGGHAWVRYEDPTKEIIIIDPAQHFVGNIKNAPKDGWNYKRPEDNF